MKFLIKIIAAVMVLTGAKTAKLPVSDAQKAPKVEATAVYEVKPEPTEVPEQKEEPKTYPLCGTVVSVEYESDEVVVEDPNGERWVFYGCEDWQFGDVCAMVMKDEGISDYIWDDEILQVRYCGHDDTFE